MSVRLTGEQNVIWGRFTPISIFKINLGRHAKRSNDSDIIKSATRNNARAALQPDEESCKAPKRNKMNFGFAG